MNQKNAQLEKQNKEIDNKVWERRRDHSQLFQNTLDLMIEMVKGKMKAPEDSEELSKIIGERDQILLLCTEIEIEDQEIKTAQVKAKIIAGELQTLKQQESQRLLELKRKRGELVVRVEQFKRRIQGYRKQQVAKEHERQRVDQELKQ